MIYVYFTNFRNFFELYLLCVLSANSHKISMYKTQTSSHGDAMVDAIDGLSELDDNQDWYSLMCNPNNSAIKNPECDTVNFYFVRHAEPQCYYPAGDRVFWSTSNSNY